MLRHPRCFINRPRLNVEHDMRIDIVHAQEHMPGHYKPYLEGHRAIRIYEADLMIGETVWRLASGKNVEITEIGIFDKHQRGKGYGTALLYHARKDIEEYATRTAISIQGVYLFCELRNRAAQKFYCKHGFTLQATLNRFYADDDAQLFGVNWEVFRSREMQRNPNTV
jgi:ribosomal protein S18 acetylase RimI-like enzyme